MRRRVTHKGRTRSRSLVGHGKYEARVRKPAQRLPRRGRGCVGFEAVAVRTRSRWTI
jgi:hypothetical protein